MHYDKPIKVERNGKVYETKWGGWAGMTPSGAGKSTCYLHFPSGIGARKFSLSHGYGIKETAKEIGMGEWRIAEDDQIAWSSGRRRCLRTLARLAVPHAAPAPDASLGRRRKTRDRRRCFDVPGGQVRYGAASG